MAQKKVNGHTPNVGHTWKLCPYSSEYYYAYYVNGDIGNSTDPTVRAAAPSVPTTDHPYTNGTMVTWVRGGNLPGFLCLDDACYFYITYGKRHFEA